MAHPNPRVLALLVLITVLGVGGWYVEVQRAKTRGALSGFFESQPTQIASRVGGRVVRIHVREGDNVHVGQELITFEAAPNQAETEAKEALAEQARARYQETRNGPRPEDIRRQEAVVAELRAALARLRNGPLPEEIGAARARLRKVQAVLARALAGARPQEIEQARAAERHARARLAQSERGLTPEERAQFKARLDAAVAQETWATEEMARASELYKEGALSRQQMERGQTERMAAEAKRREMAEALRRAEEGTPREELTQAREAYRQAEAALDLVLAGAHPDDIAANRAEVEAARQALKQLERGSRTEDIHAAQARLAQAQAVLEELRAGSRREQIAQMQAAAKAAAATAQGAQSNLADRVLRPPQDGLVERVLIAEGDLIAPGTPVLRMSNPKDLWIRVYVPEAKLARVAVGTEAELRIDGIPEPVPAEVESVATRGEFTPANLQTADERGRQVFGVRLRLKRPDARVKAGMYATVTRLGNAR